MKILTVGPGNVGKELALQARGRGHITSFFGRKDGKHTFRGMAENSDVVCITISTEGTGKEEASFILASREVGKPVVISAKGAFAYHSEQLLHHLPYMGISTMVGGASGMLHLITIPSIGLWKIVGIVNGTINSLFSATAQGMPWEQALNNAVKDGLTEGGSGLEEVFSGEIRDTILKTSCIVNLAKLFENPLIPDEFNRSVLSREEILQLFETRQYRFIIRIVERSKDQIPSTLPIFHCRKEGWDIIGGFAKPDPVEFQGIVPNGTQNALIVWTYAGRSQIRGVGAGVVSTAAMMLGEAEQLYAKVNQGN